MKTNNELDYAFWSRRKRLTEHQVVHLWCGMEPPLVYKPLEKLNAIDRQLLEAKMDGLIAFDVERTEHANGELEIEVWYKRRDLLRYAKLVGERPPFLFDCAPKTQGAEVKEVVPVSVEASDAGEPAASVREAPPRYKSGLLTFNQFLEEYPEIAKGELRFEIWRRNPQPDGKSGKILPPNGLAPAIIKKGGRIRIDVDAYFKWKRGEMPAPVTDSGVEAVASR